MTGKVRSVEAPGWQERGGEARIRFTPGDVPPVLHSDLDRYISVDCVTLHLTLHEGRWRLVSATFVGAILSKVKPERRTLRDGRRVFHGPLSEKAGAPLWLIERAAETVARLNGEGVNR